MPYVLLLKHDLEKGMQMRFKKRQMNLFRRDADEIVCGEITPPGYILENAPINKLKWVGVDIIYKKFFLSSSEKVSTFKSLELVELILRNKDGLLWIRCNVWASVCGEEWSTSQYMSSGMS